MLIKACLNGSREPGDHPALPLLPNELARETQRSVNAGAGAVHIHPRRADGAMTLAAQECDAAVAAIRKQCPGVPLGVTTAAWIEPDEKQRLRLIQAWTVLPDFASVNFSESGTPDLCAALLTKGIGVEAGLSNAEDAQLLLKMGITDRCLRILIEPVEEEFEPTLAVVEAIEHVLNEAKVQLPRLLHGSDATAWPLLGVALQRGYDTRIGLEDTLLLPDGRQARDNAELVTLAYQQASEAGRL